MRSIGYAREARQVGPCSPSSLNFGSRRTLPHPARLQRAALPLQGRVWGYCVRRAVATACSNSACMAVVMSPLVVIEK